MQLEGVRISWASKYKVNTGCESCQWVGKGAVQASPRRGLARGVPNGTIMGGNRKKKPSDPSKFKTKTRKGGHPGKAYTKTENFHMYFPRGPVRPPEGYSSHTIISMEA